MMDHFLVLLAIEAKQTCRNSNFAHMAESWLSPSSYDSSFEQYANLLD
jgi:hypothetical protein